MYLNIDNKITEGNKIIKLSTSTVQEFFPFTIDQLEERYLFSNIVVSADFGNRLFIFFTYGGQVAAFNIDGDLVSYSSTLTSINASAFTSFTDKNPSVNLDLLESANSPTVFPVKTDTTYGSSDGYVKHGFVHTCDKVLKYNIADLGANHRDSGGNILIDCDTGEPYGNLLIPNNNSEGEGILFINNNLASASNITSQGANSLFTSWFNNLDIIGGRDISLSNSLLGHLTLTDNLGFTHSSTCPIYKYIVVPIKTDAAPLNTSDIHYGVITFDRVYDVMYFRFLTDANPGTIEGADNNTYVVHNNGKAVTGGMSYANTLRYVDIPMDDTIVLSTCQGFSFNNAFGNKGLFNVGSKKYSLSANQFSIGASLTDSAFEFLYEQLPVVFGNRLMAAQDETILLQSGGQAQDLDQPLGTFKDSSNEERFANVGYFNIAYGVKHGFILMRLHSYCPVLLAPQSPDGIELHIPGGQWSYEKTVDGAITNPVQDAGGFTPMSMAFSPDNNFLYAIVANPEDRTEKYICIYNLTTQDANAILNSATMYEDPFDSGVKRVELLDDKIFFFGEDGKEYFYLTNSDSFISISNFDPAASLAGMNPDNGLDFDIVPVKQLVQRETQNNNWMGSDIPPVDSGTVTIMNTDVTDPFMLTPFGFVDLFDPAKPAEGIYSVGETWINAATLTNANGVPIVSAKLEVVDNTAVITVFNPQTNEVFSSADGLEDAVISLDSGKLSPNFYKEYDNLAIVKLKDPNKYAVITRYIDELNVPPDDYMFNYFQGYYQDPYDPDNYRPYCFSSVAIFTISADESIEFNEIGFRLLIYSNAGQNQSDTDYFTGFTRAKNATKILSLDGTNSYGVFLFTRLKISTPGLPMDYELSLVNLTQLIDEKKFEGVISISTSYTEYSTRYGSKLLPSFGLNDDDAIPPEHASIAVTHDVNFIAACLYTHSVGCFELSIYSIDASLPINTTFSDSQNTPGSIPARIEPAAAEYVTSLLGDNYIVAQMEFSRNKRNLYMLLLDQREEDFLEQQGNLLNTLPPKVLKVDIGDINDYYDGYDSKSVPTAIHSITSADIEEVSPYSFGFNFNPANLPAMFDSDLLLNSDYQAEARISGMFKGIDNQIYFTNRSSLTGELMPSFGMVINSDYIMNSGETNLTKIVKTSVNIQPPNNNTTT